MRPRTATVSSRLNSVLNSVKLAMPGQIIALALWALARARNARRPPSTFHHAPPAVPLLESAIANAGARMGDVMTTAARPFHDARPVARHSPRPPYAGRRPGHGMDARAPRRQGQPASHRGAIARTLSSRVAGTLGGWRPIKVDFVQNFRCWQELQPTRRIYWLV